MYRGKSTVLNKMTAREKERRQTGGAEKFQWCPTNDWACATLNSSGFYVNDYTKIPAFVTCKNDNTANMKWTLISLDYNDRLAHFRHMQANRLEEVPIV